MSDRSSRRMSGIRPTSSRTLTPLGRSSQKTTRKMPHSTTRATTNATTVGNSIQAPSHIRLSSGAASPCARGSGGRSRGRRRRTRTSPGRPSGRGTGGRRCSRRRRPARARGGPCRPAGRRPRPGSIRPRCRCSRPRRGLLGRVVVGRRHDHVAAVADAAAADRPEVDAARRERLGEGRHGARLVLQLDDELVGHRCPPRDACVAILTGAAAS